LSDEALLVECDPHQLEQVFLNLAMNAFDAMARDGGTLKVVSSIEEDGDSRRARIAFEDTGSGIKPEHLTRVFDPFFTTKEPGKGTGMGLAVSQSIMRDHNGEITVESAETGTRFIVALPILRSVAQPYAPGFSLMESRK